MRIDRLRTSMGRWLVATCFVLATGPPSAGQTEPNPGPTSNQATPLGGLLHAPEANLFTGSASTSIPIDVPPGRKNLSLQLALQYMSGGGPSLYGYGWDLPLGRIERSTRFGVVGCGNQDHADDFVLTLPAATVEFRRQSGVGVARIEESFLKILWNSGSNSWTVWDRSGIKYTFGATPASRAGTDANTGDPNFANCATGGGFTVLGYTFSWALTRIEDPNGNGVDITYAKNSSGVVHPLYIHYGGTTGDHPFQIQFTWDLATRPSEDHLVNGLGGFGGALDIVLSDITVRYVKPNPVQVVRRYHFDYDVTRVGRQTFLEGVTLYDANDDALERYDGMPATTELTYHDNFTVGRFGFAPTRSRLYTPWVTDWVGGRRNEADGDTTEDILDVTGDGIVDWVSSTGCEASHKWIVLRGSKAGANTPFQDWVMATPPSGEGCHIRNGARSGHDGWTTHDTIDLTGDGIPDHIDTTVWDATGHWNVAKGYVTTTGGGFGTPMPWPAPDEFIRHSHGTGTTSFDDVDLIDLNGDGRPDYVEEFGTSSAAGIWRVHYNLGDGFDTVGYDFQSRYNELRQSTAGDETVGLYDMNGDGLVDQVAVNAAGDGFDVYYNSGQRMGTPGYLGSVSGTPWPVPAALRPDELGDLDLRNSSTSGNDTYVQRQLLDLNGDGLPDLAYASGTGHWQVALNRGNGFSPTAYTWDLGTSSTGKYIRKVDTDWTLQDTFDYDGDGLLDFVTFFYSGGGFLNATMSVSVQRNAGGAWCDTSAASQVCHSGGTWTDVIPNVGATNGRGQRPDVLVATHNSLGAATYLEYRPSTQWPNTAIPFTTWTVTRIEHDDGMCNSGSCVTQGAHRTATDMVYYTGQFDPVNRQFRGFGAVDAVQFGATSDARLGRLTFFLQGAATAGKTLATMEYDAKNGGWQDTQLLKSATYVWECVNPSTGSTLPACPANPNGDVWVRLAQASENTLSNYASPIKTVQTTNHTWHQCGGKFYGNVSKRSQGNADNSVRAYTHTDYACTDTATGYIVDKPTHVEVRDTADATPALEEKWFVYDNSSFGTVTKGNVTRVESWLDQWHTGPTTADACSAVGGKSCVRVSMAYDAYGNVTSVIDHHGISTDTTYDPDTHLYPELVTRAGFYRTKSVHDPACGVRLSETILYTTGFAVPSEASAWQYDSFCRLIRTAMPDENITSAPHTQYFYSLGGEGVPTKIQIRMREPSATDPPSPSGTRDGYTLSDGLGRVIQQQRTAVVNGLTAYLSDTTEYDLQGRIAKRYAPDAVATLGTFDPPAASVGFTTVLYDGLGRTVRETNPDGTYRETDHTVAWQTTTKDECYVDASCRGAKIVEMRDALGRVTERQWFDEDTFETRTVFDYDELGRLTKSTQDATPSIPLTTSTLITHTYDSLGRKTQTTDPDSGTWNYRYDALGNLKVEDDPVATHHIQYCYDQLSRMTESCAMNGNYSTPHTCGSTCPGERIVYSYDGNGAYGWGKLTQVTDGSGSTTVTGYDVRGRILGDTKLIDPDTAAPTSAHMSYAYDTADRLTQLTYPDGEIVEYGYNAVGQVKRLRSVTHQIDYLKNLTYDEFGHPKAVYHGNDTVDTRTYSDKTQNFRLAQIKTTKMATTQLQYDYEGYTKHGRLTQLTDNGIKGPGDVMDVTATYTYDGLARLTGTTAAYGSHSFEYKDHLGNLTKKDANLLTYAAGTPHTPVSVGATSLTHDSNGSRQSKGSATYVHDYRDRLVDVNSGQVTLTYDYGGRRVIKTVGGTVTAYYNRYVEASNGYLAKYYYVGDQMIAMHRRLVSGFALLTPAEPIELAGVSLTHPALIVRLRGDTQQGAGIALIVLIAGLGLAPWQRRRVAGIVLRHGDVILVALAVTITSLPLPLIVQPVYGQGQGCDPPPTSTPTRTPTRTHTPTRTPTAVPLGEVFHFHTDHLGSTHLITDVNGDPYRFIRYTPYGTVRARYNGSGASTGFDERFRYEFTGYESESVSGLAYAGARFYDPDLGMFLTHDPARQFANPYAYGPWDPVNGTDPTGTLFGIDDALIGWAIAGFVIGFAASAIQASVNGASVGQALKAGAISGAIGGVTGVGLGVVSGLFTPISPVVGVAYNTALAGSSAYAAVESFKSGQGVLAALSVVGVAFGLYSAGESGGLWGGEETAQAGNGIGGKQVAGLESDAQVPDVTVEPGLQPGDRSAAMTVGERIRGAQVRAMIAKYGGNIDAAASEFGVDADLIRGIIFEEQTHLLPGEGLAERYGAGRTIGLGQVSEGLHGFTRAQLLDPGTNIRAIGTHLSYLQGQPLISARAPLASLATSYNCGSCGAITAYGRRVVFYRSQFLGGP